MTGTPGLPLEERAESLTDWARAHGKAVGLAAIGVAVIASVVAIYSSTERTKNLRAEQALAAAEGTYAAGNLPLANSDLERLATRFDGTRAATDARVLQAQIAYDQGKPADGLKVLDKLPSGGAIGATVLAMRAAGYEQQRQFDRAAKLYLEAAAQSGTSSDTHRHQAEAARAYAAGGKSAEAEKIWRDLLASGDQYYAQEADLRIGELTARPARGG